MSKKFKYDKTEYWKIQRFRIGRHLLQTLIMQKLKRWTSPLLGIYLITFLGHSDVRFGTQPTNKKMTKIYYITWHTNKNMADIYYPMYYDIFNLSRIFQLFMPSIHLVTRMGTDALQKK